jgi:N-acetylglutamate synthase-like GNAT family acetyltransferase
MKLRFARIEDVEHLVELGRQIHAESRFAQMPYAQEKLRGNLRGLLKLQDERQTHCFILAENSEGEVIGILIGALEEFFFSDAKSANSILLWVDPAYRGSPAALRLIGAFHDWARQRRAQEVCILVLSGVSIGKTDRFLRRLGFVQTGGNYRMPLLQDASTPDTSA